MVYDPAYYSIDYPNGDVPADCGVCTDVIIRAYRILGIDLQKEVHEDMCSNFEAYPKKWGLSGTDSNIDHRRVPNLMVYFSRHGEVKQISENKYLVDLTIQSQKFRADSIGSETEIEVNDWIDVGIYSKDNNGNDIIHVSIPHLISETIAGVEKFFREVTDVNTLKRDK